MKTITCKLPDALNADLEAIARDKGVSKSEVVRDALANQVKRVRRKPKQSAYDLVKDLCGSLSGHPDILTNPRHMDDFGA